MKRGYLIVLSFVFVSCLSTSVSIPDGYNPISESETESIYKKYDAFQDVYFYKNATFFETQPAEIYVVKKGDASASRIVFTYIGYDWIFMKYAIFLNSSEERLIIPIDSLDIDAKVLSSNTIRERVDLRLSNDQVSQLHSLLSDDPAYVRLRLSGDYYKDYELSEEVTNALILMITSADDF